MNKKIIYNLIIFLLLVVIIFSTISLTDECYKITEDKFVLSSSRFNYNNPPHIIFISHFPDWPNHGLTTITYHGEISINDPDGDDIYYFVDWDDGTNTGWLGPYNEGVFDISHAWFEEGYFQIDAFAKDIYGAEDSDGDTAIIDWHPPYIPTNLNPNGEDDVSMDNIIFQWDSGDPDSYDFVTYELYLDTTNPPDEHSTPFAKYINEEQYRLPYNQELKSCTYYYWFIIASDNHGKTSKSSTAWFKTVGNCPPRVPRAPYPSDGEVNISIYDTLSWNCDDYNGDYLEYDVYLGTSKPPNKITTVDEKKYSLINLEPLTKYYWKIVAKDYEYSTEGPIWTFTTSSNQYPNKPSKPQGQISGEYGKEYNYTTSTTDPDGDQIWYKWDWDDETSGWLGPYDSGDPITTSHTWDDEGDYEIKVKAKDQHGAESEWSDPLSITMPKNKTFNFISSIILWFFERFPFLQSYSSNFMI